MNSKLLKEAIADAKAVRETALANAKIALEEAFAPKLQSMLSRKLRQEMEGDEDLEEDEMLQKENDVSSEIGKGDNKQPAKKAFDSAAESDELGAADVDKETAKAGLEDENVEFVDDLTEDEVKDIEEDEEVTDVTGATPGTGYNESEEYSHDSDDLEEDEFELDSIIKELEKDVQETEGGDVEESEFDVQEESDLDQTDLEETDSIEFTEDEDLTIKGESAEGDLEEDEIDLDAILKEMGYGDTNEEDALDVKEDETKADVTEDEVKALEKEVEDKEAQLKEAHKVIRSLKGTINEVNLLNAKLLFVNKLFRSYNLTNEQKTKVVETLDRTKNVREVKLVYSTIAESFKVGHSGKKQIAKLTESYNTRTAKSTAPAKKLITESSVAARFKKLAGISKK